MDNINENLKISEIPLDNSNSKNEKNTTEASKKSNFPSHFISIIRFKKLNHTEIKKGKKLLKIDNNIIKVNNKILSFDFVFPEITSQELLFTKSILPYIDMCLEGQCMNILAVGQSVFNCFT